jgi:hypothetical protein
LTVQPGNAPARHRHRRGLTLLSAMVDSNFVVLGPVTRKRAA